MSKHPCIGTKLEKDLQAVKHDAIHKQLLDKELIIGKSTREVIGKLDSGKQNKALFDIRSSLVMVCHT